MSPTPDQAIQIGSRPLLHNMIQAFFEEWDQTNAGSLIRLIQSSLTVAAHWLEV